MLRIVDKTPCPHYQENAPAGLKKSPSSLSVIRESRNRMMCMPQKGWADSPSDYTVKTYCEGNFSACPVYSSAKQIDDVFLKSLLSEKQKVRATLLKKCCSDFFGKPDIFEKDFLEFFKICTKRYDRECYCIEGDPIREFGRTKALLLQEYLSQRGLIAEVYFF